jgi:FlaA1/EpsC-like NDP-sugar epimerase
VAHRFGWTLPGPEALLDAHRTISRHTASSIRGIHQLTARVGESTRARRTQLRAALRSSARVPTKRRLALVVIGQLALIPASAYFAFWLRFEGAIPPDMMDSLVQTLPWLIAIRGLVFIPFGLYGGLWRYTGIWDLTRIVLAVFTSSLILYIFVHRPMGPGLYPRSIIAIDPLLLVYALGGLRLLRRSAPSLLRSRSGRRVLIIGAGDAGDMIVREMLKGSGYVPVGFIDDDPDKLGRTIHGIKVLGDRSNLARVVTATRAAEALVAIPSASPDTVRAFVEQLQGLKIPITTLPSLKELVNGRVGVKQIRPLAIEDLLPRTQVELNPAGVRRLIRGKSVLVTGAGGSIGSELCRQIVTLEPAELILYERYENSLYTIANDLADRGVDCSVHPVIGDVTDAALVEKVFDEYRPQLVFHAAAHKHVPLMEANPCEAIKNNVAGTRVVGQAARTHGAERFVLISTDKAANPSSVMGASKRVAELIVHALGARTRRTRFVTVRFGNVLGSNGSVIPRMLDQIRAGGPVTVTHPEIRRYFMLIPEAVQLVLQSAALARDRETFVLDMGEQLKVLDVATNLIRLSGFVPHEEIPITFIGLRPGEKLVEELAGAGEALEPAPVQKVMRVRARTALDAAALTADVDSLVELAALGRSQDVLASLRQIVPTFNPDASHRPSFSDRPPSPPVPRPAHPQPGRAARNLGLGRLRHGFQP